LRINITTKSIYPNYNSADTKNEIKEIEQINTDLDKLDKTISPCIQNEKDQFVFNNCKGIREEKNKQYRSTLKNINRINENKKLEKLMTDKMELHNKEGRDQLSNEKKGLDSALRISENIKMIGHEVDEELDTQDKTLLKNKDKILTIMSKVPIIHKVLTNIKFHRYKEKIILGIVIGVIVFLGLYLTYY
jgi:hypothetical protein